MPPPLAVIWRTWPQILSPFTIWAVLNWLQSGFSFRLIPPSSPVVCQVRLTHRLSTLVFICYIHTDSGKISWSVLLCVFCCHITAAMHTLLSYFIVRLLWLCALCCHITMAMRALLSYFIVRLLWLCALCCHIIITVHVLYIVSVRLIDIILSIFRLSFHTVE